MIRWSESQAWAFGCPRRWWMRYVAQVPAAQPDAPERLAGRAKHVAMETAYTIARDRRVPDATMEPTIDRAARALETYWLREDPDARGWDIQRAVEDVGTVLASLPMPARHAIIGPELKFEVQVPETGMLVTLIGVIDLGLWTGPDSIHVRDWKSGKVPEVVTGNRQLSVYDYVIRMLVPKVRAVTVGLYSLRYNAETEGELGEDRDHTLMTMMDTAHEVAAKLEAAKQPGAEAGRIFPTNPSPECLTCPFRSYCPITDSGVWPVRDGVDVDAERAKLSRRLNPVTVSP